MQAFADLQIFLVTLVGLILRISPSELQKDPLSRGFLLCALQGQKCGHGEDLDAGAVVEQTIAASFYGEYCHRMEACLLAHSTWS